MKYNKHLWIASGFISLVMISPAQAQDLGVEGEITRIGPESVIQRPALRSVIRTGTESVRRNTTVINPYLDIRWQFNNSLELLTPNCSAYNGSQFSITGRGGLPSNPIESLSSDAVWTDMRRPVAEREHLSRPVVLVNPTSAKPAPSVEAQGWALNSKGQVVLTVSAPAVTPHGPWQKAADCQAIESKS